MLPTVALQIIAALTLALVASLQQQRPVEPVPPRPTPAFFCDGASDIRCRFDEAETLTGARSVDDLRIVGKYIRLVSERNRRYYLRSKTRRLSAAYEVVKRVKSFPYLPVSGDSYSIVGLEIVVDEQRDVLLVRYPKNADAANRKRRRPDVFVEYRTGLAVFIDALQKEVLKLKRYEK